MDLEYFFALGILTLLLKMSLLPKFKKYEQHKYHRLKYHDIPPSNPIKPWPFLPKHSFHSKSPTLIHLHIPKTAGSQFKRLLASSTMSDPSRPTWYRNINSWFPAVRDYSWAAAGCAKTRQNVKSKSCLYGNNCKEKTGNELDAGTHCGMSEMEDCILKKDARLDYENFRDWTYISSIREPVNRVLSEFYWWRGKGCLQRHITSQRLTRAWTFELCSQTKNLTNWILHENNSAHNRQFKSLVFFKNLTVPLLDNNDSNCNNMDGYKEHDFWKTVPIYNDLRDARLLEKVISDIEEKFFFVGLTENMEESTEAALKLMHLPFTDNMKRNIHYRISGGAGHVSHVHDAGDEIKEYHREMILERNWLDVQLYEYISQKLDATLDHLKRG